jgi:hypothetical protein
MKLGEMKLFLFVEYVEVHVPYIEYLSNLKPKIKIFLVVMS